MGAAAQVWVQFVNMLAGDHNLQKRPYKKIWSNGNVTPHQNDREKARRVRQRAAGIIA